MSENFGESLKNRRIIITGATSGIGFATTLSFARYKAFIAVTGRNEARGEILEDKIRKLGGKGRFIKADLRFRKDIDKLVEKSLEFLGGVDILINNAGVDIYKSIIDTSLDEFEELYKVNLIAPFYLMKKIIPIMVKNREGIIINVTSTAGLSPYPYGGAYCSSKSALISLSKVASLEYGKYGVRIVAFAPGLVQTSMFFKGVPKDEEEKYLKKASLKVPLGRIAKAEDIADIIVFLASDKAWYITGSVVVADGGLIVGRRESGNIPPSKL